MKKIELGQAITILANVGVIAGIVFLAYEIRQNSESLRAQTRTDITANFGSIIERLMDDDMVSVLAKRVVGEEFSLEERIKYNLYIRRQFRNTENVFYQYRMGNFFFAMRSLMGTGISFGTHF